MVPDFAAAICGSLRAGNLSFRGRAKPRPSKPCPISDTVYKSSRPRDLSVGPQYRTIVGDLRGDTRSHGFASLAEALLGCRSYFALFAFAMEFSAVVSVQEGGQDLMSSGGLWMWIPQTQTMGQPLAWLAHWNDPSRSTTVFFGGLDQLTGERASCQAFPPQI